MITAYKFNRNKRRPVVTSIRLLFGEENDLSKYHHVLRHC